MAAVDDTLFFAGSDEEEAMSEPQAPAAAQSDISDFEDSALHDAEPGAPSRSPSPEPEPLFLAESDEDADNAHCNARKYAESYITQSVDDARDDIEFLPPDISRKTVSRPEDQRASSISSVSSAPPPRTSSPAPSDCLESIEEPPTKRRRLSAEAGSSSASFDAAFLGTFIVGHAWSTVKGTGYVKVSYRQL